MGLPISPLCDRQNTLVAESQIGTCTTMFVRRKCRSYGDECKSSRACVLMGAGTRQPECRLRTLHQFLSAVSSANCTYHGRTDNRCTLGNCRASSMQFFAGDENTRATAKKGRVVSLKTALFSKHDDNDQQLIVIIINLHHFAWGHRIVLKSDQNCLKPNPDTTVLLPSPI